MLFVVIVVEVSDRRLDCTVCVTAIYGEACLLLHSHAMHPVYGLHDEPLTPVTSEPCFVKASIVHRINTELAQRFQREHALYVYHSQCHYQVPDPTWDCTQEGCREWRR